VTRENRKRGETNTDYIVFVMNSRRLISVGEWIAWCKVVKLDCEASSGNATAVRQPRVRQKPNHPFFGSRSTGPGRLKGVRGR
jgi:hypothetical protein